MKTIKAIAAIASFLQVMFLAVGYEPLAEWLGIDDTVMAEGAQKILAAAKTAVAGEDY